MPVAAEILVMIEEIYVSNESIGFFVRCKLRRMSFSKLNFQYFCQGTHAVKKIIGG